MFVTLKNKMGKNIKKYCDRLIVPLHIIAMNTYLKLIHR